MAMQSYYERLAGMAQGDDQTAQSEQAWMGIRAAQVGMTGMPAPSSALAYQR